MPALPGEDEESWLYAMSTWKIALIGYASGLVVGLCIGYTVLNELGNKWVEKFKKSGKRNRRRCRTWSIQLGGTLSLKKMVLDPRHGMNGYEVHEESRQ
ncbi:hypothetical protein PVK06_010013 [Gossypium arboreum]|uniref:Uncharacterized protein n=1 Tax=Gossypium arboreum TaxID=29729 RepID=A0ABR0QP43_GOSAR|nr:hypothetical protein PVK06_010013 [Gossypium arboreum]